jgi:bacillithiol system protein YtxJ
MQFTPLTDISQLNDIDFKSHLRKQVLLKHSTRCIVSRTILKQVTTELEHAKDDSEFDIYYLDLLKHRDVSNEIAHRYKIKHESPQILVIDKATCSYNASHSEVSLHKAGLM